MKPTAPGSLSHIFALRSILFAPFYLDLLKQKYKNILLHFILFAIYLFNLLQLSPINTQFLAPSPERELTTPLTRLVARCCYLCAGVVYVVFAWFSYWLDNLGFISEGNTYRRYAASSLPLRGNTDVASSNIKRNFWRRCRGGSST